MPHRSFPLSEGVRGSAQLAIILVHVFLVTGTYGEDLASRMIVRLDVCVSLFFTLSAFLLYRPMIAHRSGGPDGPSVRQYARRRFFRVYPVYWVVLTILAIIPGLAGVFSGDWWSFYTLWFNYDAASAGSDCLGTQELCGLPQTWTLVTELTFYALLPLYAWGAAALARRAGERWLRAELLLIGAMMAVTVALYLIPGFPREEPWFRFSFLGHFDWLGLGLILAVLSVAYERRGRPSPDHLPRLLKLLSARPALSFGTALAIYALMVVALPPIPFPLAPDVADVVPMHLGHAAMAFLIMIPVVFGDPNQGLVRRFLGHPAMVWLGLASYGMYLWHFSIAYGFGIGGSDMSFWPVLILTLGLSIPLGALSFYLVEKPMMRFKYKRRPRTLA